MSLKTQALAGVKWTTISQVVRQIVQFATTVVLTRLLLPTDFGLMGMATIATGFANLFADLGTASAIIQRKELSNALLSSIFWFNIAFGLGLTFLFILIAPLVALFYNEPRMTGLLQVLSVSFVISSLGIVQKARLERSLTFHLLAKIEIVATIVGAVVGIGSALSGYGAWSLVYQLLSIATVTTMLLWVWSNWKPSFQFCWSDIRAISRYSLNLSGSRIFNYFSRNADYLLIGRYLGAQQLGYYTLAYRIMLYPLQNISQVIGRVMFPSFSQIQDDNALFRQTYLKIISLIALITFPLMLGLMVLADHFILFIAGAEWAPVIIILIILAPVGMSQSLGTTVGTIYQAKGRTDWMFKWGVISGTLTVAAFAYGLNWGIIGVALAYAIATFLRVYPNYAIPFKLINLPVGELAKVVWYPLVCGLLMAVAVIGVRLMLPVDLKSIWVLAVCVPLGGMVYALATWFINRERLRLLWRMIGA